VAGNTVRHIQAGYAAGAQTHLLLTGKCAAYSLNELPPELPAGVHIHNSLDGFVTHLLDGGMTTTTS
jgi:D-glycero-D-manno-heptose 1,7-bisphosphate phosphatase